MKIRLPDFTEEEIRLAAKELHGEEYEAYRRITERLTDPAFNLIRQFTDSPFFLQQPERPLMGGYLDELRKSNTPPEKQNPTFTKPFHRKNALHALIEKVFITLQAEFKRAPQAREILDALIENEENYDTGDIIQEIKDDVIYWRSDNDVSCAMGFKALQNRVSIIKKKLAKQKVKKNIQA